MLVCVSTVFNDTQEQVFSQYHFFFITMAGVKYMIQKHPFLLRYYQELNYDIKLLREEFKQEFPNRGFPTRCTIYNMDQKFKRTGSVDDALCSSRPRDVHTEENV